MSQFPPKAVSIGSLELFGSATTASSSVSNIKTVLGNEDQRSDKAVSPQLPLDLREGAGRPVPTVPRPTPA